MSYKIVYDIHEDTLHITRVNKGNADYEKQGNYGIELECSIYDIPVGIVIYEASIHTGFTKKELQDFAGDL